MADIELFDPTPNGYSQAVRIPAGHDLVWTSGQIPVDADGSVPDGWAAQTRLALRNVGAALAAAGATWADVVKLTLYVTDTTELPTLRAVRDEFLAPERQPTSSLVRVAGLVRPDLLVEIEAVAAVPAG